MDEQEARGLLADVVVRPTDLEGYTHDIAARVLKVSKDEFGLASEFHVIADERGHGPLTWRVEWRDVLSVLEELAAFGGECLRYWPDGGIEFYPRPVDPATRALLAKLFPDANKEA